MDALLRVSERVGSMRSRLLLPVLYCVVRGPVALGDHWVSDPLHLKRRPAGYWTRWTGRNDTLSAARRQD